MTHIRLAAIVFSAATALLLTPARAHDYRIGQIHIDHPWAIATPNGAKVGAGYMKITNDGTQADRLIALTSPIARKVVLHGSVKEGDVVKMRTLDKGIEIKPGETIDLSPEGTHVMFEGLREPLIEAKRFKGTLVFEKAGKIDVDYAIEAMGTKVAPPAMVNHQH